MVAYEVRVPPGLQDSFRGAHHAARELVAATEASAVLFLEAVAPITPVGVAGTLRGANQSEIYGSDAAVYGRVFNPASYALPVHDGGRPHFAPFNKILAWAKRVIGGKDAKAAAGRIWFSIAHKGTKANKFYRSTWVKVAPRINARYERALERIAEKLGGRG